MANLEQVIKWSNDKVKCEICRFPDNYEDMIEVEEDGTIVIVHRECLEDNG